MAAESKPVRDLLITAIETNSRHGVGILLQRMFPDSSEFVCLRSSSQHDGAEPFGTNHHELRSGALPKNEAEEALRNLLSAYRIRRILAVPYYPSDFLHAILAKRLTGAPLCVYLMDDQNVFASGVPDERVAALLAAADLRLGISPELCAAYGKKYTRHFHLLPPVLTEPHPLVECAWPQSSAMRCAMIGNIWTGDRLIQLRRLLRETGLHVDWYGPGATAHWHAGTPQEWASDNLHCCGVLEESELVAKLATYPFALVPSGSGDRSDDNRAFSRLSLPSRLLFLHARVETPVLVLGSPATAAGHFVTRLGTGRCTQPNARALAAAVEQMIHPDRQRRMRAAIRNAAPKLVLPDSGAWLWRSLLAGKALDAPFSPLFPAMNRLRYWRITWAVKRYRDSAGLQTAQPRGNIAAPNGSAEPARTPTLTDR